MPQSNPPFKCDQTLCRHTYYNYGSYLRSRGYDKEICNLIMELQNGHIPIKGIKVDPELDVLTIHGNVNIIGNLTVDGILSGRIPSSTPPPPLYADMNYNAAAGASHPFITYSVSSYRYKSNIADVDLSESRKILGISAKSFTYNDAPTEKRIGAIAEDLDAAGLKEYIKYDDQGRPDGVYYQAMVPPLIEIIKDLTTRVENLETSNKLLLEKLS